MKNIKTLKRILLLVLCAAMIFTMLACSNDKNDDTDGDDDNGGSVELSEIKIGVLKGATGMGTVKLAEDSANGNTTGKYNISFYETASVKTLNAAVINGTVDIAALPVNAGATLYNKNDGKVQVLAANALGVLSIVGKNELSSISELAGKTIHTTGRASTPEYILNYILDKNGLGTDDVTIEYYDDGSKALAALKKDISDGKTDSVAMLPEPATTSALAQNPDLKLVFDVTSEWDKVSDTKLVQGCLVVNKAFADAHPNEIKNFISEYTASVAWISANKAAAAELIVKYGMMGNATLAEKSIPRANIVCMVGSEMKTAVGEMLGVLYNADKSSVGGSLPGDGYYYVAE